eukprot:3819204-Rhodomonas_salina.1
MRESGLGGKGAEKGVCGVRVGAAKQGSDQERAGATKAESEVRYLPTHVLRIDRLVLISRALLPEDSANGRTRAGLRVDARAAVPGARMPIMLLVYLPTPSRTGVEHDSTAQSTERVLNCASRARRWRVSGCVRYAPLSAYARATLCPVLWEGEAYKSDLYPNVRAARQDACKRLLQCLGELNEEEEEEEEEGGDEDAENEEEGGEEGGREIELEEEEDDEEGPELGGSSVETSQVDATSRSGVFGCCEKRVRFGEKGG